MAADEAATWLKGRRKSAPAVTLAVVWPEAPSLRTGLAAGLAELSGWRGGAVILERPGMPRPSALADLCELQAAHGVASTPDDIQLGRYPGHLFDADPATNRGLVRRLLDIMMGGYLEGHLVAKDSRFWATVGCGIVDFRVADKSISGSLREVTRSLQVTLV
jgi:hypothetical protein